MNTAKNKYYQFDANTGKSVIIPSYFVQLQAFIDELFYEDMFAGKVDSEALYERYVDEMFTFVHDNVEWEGYDEDGFLFDLIAEAFSMQFTSFQAMLAAFCKHLWKQDQARQYYWQLQAERLKNNDL